MGEADNAELLALEHEGDLASFCPHCHAPLNVYDPETKRVWIGLGVQVDGAACELLLDPRLDTYERRCSGGWSDDALAEDVCCPHCDTTLVEADANCERCEAPVFGLEVSVHTRVVPLALCTRAGCAWHGCRPGPGRRSSPSRRARRSRSRTPFFACATSPR